ncbi:hypothetical protein Leryth_011790 [Lithospermum erythrorhizon]|nr:hypothetical protein Leryth_011790 [Lithospermum erythrorhizon]
MSRFKGRKKSNSNNSSKYVGVRQRASGRWVAEIKDTTQKIRMWLGTYETAEEAARAYDQAACLLRGSKTRTNFVTNVSPDSPLASRIRSLLNSKRNTKQHCEETFFYADNSSPEPPTSPSPETAISADCSSPEEPTIINPINNTSDSIISVRTNGSDESIYSSKIEDRHLFDDAYKPDLSTCCNEFITVSSQQDISWDLEQSSDKYKVVQDLLLPKTVTFPEKADTEFPEFERMRVERQISASLYAINGVQEYMEAVYDPSDFWDLPPLCPLFC